MTKINGIKSSGILVHIDEEKWTKEGDFYNCAYVYSIALSWYNYLHHQIRRINTLKNQEKRDIAINEFETAKEQCLRIQDWMQSKFGLPSEHNKKYYIIFTWDNYQANWAKAPVEDCPEWDFKIPTGRPSEPLQLMMDNEWAWAH